MSRVKKYYCKEYYENLFMVFLETYGGGLTTDHIWEFQKSIMSDDEIIIAQTEGLSIWEEDPRSSIFDESDDLYALIEEREQQTEGTEHATCS